MGTSDIWRVVGSVRHGGPTVPNRQSEDFPTRIAVWVGKPGRTAQTDVVPQRSAKKPVGARGLLLSDRTAPWCGLGSIPRRGRSAVMEASSWTKMPHHLLKTFIPSTTNI